ncbi:hypothetical protein GQ457_06G035690 [Hibiscus cannabinus]
MDLDLSLCSVFVPKTISEFLTEVYKIKNGVERSSKITDFIRRLEDEMKKIDGFKRELPLCMFLLKYAAERLKMEKMLCEGLDEGLSLKKNDGGDKKNRSISLRLSDSDFDNFDRKKKKPTIFPELKLGNEEGRVVMSENPFELCSYKSRGGAFVPFKDVSGPSLTNPSFELASHIPILNTNGGYAFASGSSITAEKPQFKFQTKPKHEQQQPEDSRKNRRCWSPYLHRRFVEALELLGGSQVATPKQIKQLMQVDGLTNDEVKSHLQKYRLHVRKHPGGSSSQRQCTEFMNLHSDSPQGPLIGSSTGVDSLNAGEDEKSDGHSWRI